MNRAESELRRKVRKHQRSGEILPTLRGVDQLIEMGVATSRDWRTMGVGLCKLGEFAQSIGALEHCLRETPDDVEARYELARAWYKLGDVDASIAVYESLAKEFNNPNFLMGYATILPGAPSATNLRVRNVRQKYAEVVRQNERVTLPKPSNRRPNNRHRLRIGYLSAHLHHPNYMKPVWPLLNQHDRERFEVYLFDDSDVSSPDWHWLDTRAEKRRVGALSNAQVAEQIRSAEIDILIDLSAFSEPKRLGVFVHRPAPIQVAWFNSFATSGFEEFDYLIGDRFVFRKAEQKFYTETVIPLSTSYLTFHVAHDAPPVGESPCRRDRSFTFGCLATQYKITPMVFDAWSQILEAASSATLVLANRELESKCNQQYVLDQFTRRRVDARRIRFLPPAKHLDFLKYYDQIDLTLDTFPYNGGTTTMESLWQGVPVLSFNGDRWASRTSRSILHSTHLSKFCPESRDAMIQMAIEYATIEPKQAELTSIRSEMRDQLLRSNACDTRRFVQEMEKALCRLGLGLLRE
ncbi:hypothetical protein Q31b_48500 [Novipirellula aureliae]|uniref:protein O-GlcNAc transferase n=1 Tax=Novipirellula aureliae TaxID=2527966 RepID=A0A5C6DP41_9BACT|nr:tetratricopeptide repeat protein [Novipirellula aureliae]TWU36569.1 hypothetical protein Q31b_48500 [Novipirellula aureliae]